jgi:ribosomal protein L21E
MTKTLTAEYLADEQKLKLHEPLEDFEDGARVEVTIASSARSREHRRWQDLEGCLSGEAGHSLTRALDEAFSSPDE